MNRFWLGLVLALVIIAMSPASQTLAAGQIQPKVTSVGAKEVKPGDVFTISGENLLLSYETYCDNMFGRGSQKKCHPKSVVGAYKNPRNHISPMGSQPDFRLKILSATGGSAQVQVPSTITSGDGAYNLGWFWEYDRSELPEQAGQLVGFARYDPLTLTGAGAAVIPTKRIVATPARSASSTADAGGPTPTLVPTNTPTPTLMPTSTPMPTPTSVPTAVSKISNWLTSLFSFWRK